MGETHLRLGDYRSGWLFYEMRETRLRSPIRKHTSPEWDGSPGSGDLIVWGEQGIGDEVQFGRFIPRLRALGFDRLHLGVLPANVRLFQQFGADAVFDRMARNSVPRCPWTMLCSLPYRLGLMDEADIRSAPYLHAPMPGGGGIGIVWRGNPLNPKNEVRSLPCPDALLEAFPGARLLEPQGDTLDSANQLAGLDALVTVDTSWAHLAGALGVPTCLLLTDAYHDWRWRDGEGASAWYPSVTMFRQRLAGDWREPIRRAREFLMSGG